MVITPKINYTTENYSAGLMDQLYGILDSKIQYQEFKINQAVKSYVDIEPYFPGQDKVGPDHPFAKLMENNARVLEVIDTAGARIKLLFIIRKRLNHENAQVVFQKISDGSIENYTPGELMNFFDQPWDQQKEIA